MLFTKRVECPPRCCRYYILSCGRDDICPVVSLSKRCTPTRYNNPNDGLLRLRIVLWVAPLEALGTDRVRRRHVHVGYAIASTSSPSPLFSLHRWCSTCSPYARSEPIYYRHAITRWALTGWHPIPPHSVTGSFLHFNAQSSLRRRDSYRLCLSRCPAGHGVRHRVRGERQTGSL